MTDYLEDNDSWFLIESKDDTVWVSHVDEDGEPFDTLDAKYTVYYGYDSE